MTLPRNFSIQPFDQDSEQDRYFTECARARNITPHALVRRLLVAIAKDRMVNAILDDDAKPEERRRFEKRFSERQSAKIEHPQYDAANYPL